MALYSEHSLGHQPLERVKQNVTEMLWRWGPHDPAGPSAPTAITPQQMDVWVI